VKLGIVGYGKMGRMIEQLAPEYGFTVTAKADQSYEITASAFAGVDAAIDFSIADAVIPNTKALAALGVNLVIGTTGWLDKIDELKGIIAAGKTGCVWGPNFSIGVLIFSRLVSEAAQLMQNEADYESWAWEAHHSAKKDAPSGTMLKLVADMRAAGYTKHVDVSSTRAGKIPGTHEIGFDSSADTITLTHTARSREGFARGALKAAQWVVGKQGFHEFSDIIFQSGGGTCS
jgi:4-hydroxy-tetrahydrodipicolinate reductase